LSRRRKRSFRFEARATTFLYRIASNVACDHLRKRSTKARAAETSDEALGELAASMPDLVEVTIAKQHLSILMKGLLKLEPEERLAFVLVCVESLPADVAAEQMAVSTVTVRRYIKSARDKLARLLEPKATPAVPPTLWRPI
jgi:RNA polymerase sigma-70 factor, ECF subfamily